MAKAEIIAASGVMPVSDGEIPRGKDADPYEGLKRWVLSRTEQWRTWRDSNYSARWLEYERLWRGIWSKNDSLRESERSRIVTPALSEAVENAAAELEEAIFGRGTDYFDITPYDSHQIEVTGEQDAAAAPQMPETGMAMPETGMPGAMQPGPMPGMMPAEAPEASPDPDFEVKKSVEAVRTALREDLGRSDFAANCVKCILNGAVFGTGIGEVILRERTIKKPVYDSGLGMVRSDATKLTIAHLRPIHPRNFLWDPLAENVEDGLGVAIEEVVSKHVVLEAQKSDNYRKGIELCEGFVDDPMLYGDQAEDEARDTSDKVHQLRYYGKVPKRLLNPKAEGEGGDDASAQSIRDDDDLVEACVVIINKRAVAKAVRNPYVMQDRPVVLFPWDVVPGRLMGRGICEKGSSAQKILDAEVRARLDSLALVTAPMMGIDANRVPRGAKFVVRPGASFLTNGNPNEVMHQFKFGELDPNHWQNAQELKAMVAQATGSVDAAALAGSASDARSGAMSMAMAPIIKRYKRTLVHFLDQFLMPALEKITWRNMQYQPERYPAVPLKFKAASTMGIMQREYETAQLSSLLASLEPGTAEHRAVLMGVVANTSIPNREHVIELIESGEERERVALAMAALQQQDPMVQQLQQTSVALEIAEKQAKIAELQSRADLNTAKARETGQLAEMQAMSLAAKGIYALPEEQQRAEFDRRFKMAQLALKQADINEKRADRASNERITASQMRMSLLRDQVKAGNDMRKEQMKARAKAERPAPRGAE